MRYCMLYLKTKNVNLIKDMGMIPYKLHKLFGYDSVVATYNDDVFTYLNDEVKGLKIDFVEKKYNSFSLDGARYLRKKSKEIDVLQIFHVTISSVFYAFMYKFLNPKGKLFLKLDCSHKLVERIQSLNFIFYKLLNVFLNKIDLISVEQEELYPKLKELLPMQSSKIINLSNGVDYDYLEAIGIQYDFNCKENIILNVARIGAPEKNTEMLLEAFKNIKDIENSSWKLVLIGPIEEGYNLYLSKYLRDNPKLADKIIVNGPIEDRKELFEQYKKAKIFCLTSEFESFGIAFIEAAALGSVIVSTDVGIAKEIISAGNGAVVPVDDTEVLSNELYKFMTDNNLEKHCYNTYKICKDKFDWNAIIKKLHSSIENLSK